MGKPQNKPKSLVHKKKDSDTQGRNGYSKEAVQAAKQKQWMQGFLQKENKATTSIELQHRMNNWFLKNNGSSVSVHVPPTWVTSSVTQTH